MRNSCGSGSKKTRKSAGGTELETSEYAPHGRDGEHGQEDMRELWEEAMHGPDVDSGPDSEGEERADRERAAIVDMSVRRIRHRAMGGAPGTMLLDDGPITIRCDELRELVRMCDERDEREGAPTSTLFTEEEALEMWSTISSMAENATLPVDADADLGLDDAVQSRGSVSARHHDQCKRLYSVGHNCTGNNHAGHYYTIGHSLHRP